MRPTTKILIACIIIIITTIIGIEAGRSMTTAVEAQQGRIDQAHSILEELNR